MSRIARKTRAVCQMCGWVGQRAVEVYAPVTLTLVSGRRVVAPRWLPQDPTAKPCPRPDCGGTVASMKDGERP